MRVQNNLTSLTLISIVTAAIFIGCGGGSGNSIQLTTKTEETGNFNTSFNAVAYGNNIFVAAGHGDTILTSTGGVNWATRATSMGSLRFDSFTQNFGILEANDNYLWKNLKV